MTSVHSFLPSMSLVAGYHRNSRRTLSTSLQSWNLPLTESSLSAHTYHSRSRVFVDAITPMMRAHRTRSDVQSIEFRIESSDLRSSASSTNGAEGSGRITMKVYISTAKRAVPYSCSSEASFGEQGSPLGEPAVSRQLSFASLVIAAGP